MTDDLRRQLTEAAKKRAQLDQAGKQAHLRENELIGEAWRAGIHPDEIRDITGRSPAHVRAMRPDDVPPLRRGGGAASPKRRPKRKTPPR